MPRGIAKWGFGMAPISAVMRARYDAAVQAVADLLEGNTVGEDIDLDHISELKGMFNRCVRQDQWDWVSVHNELGLPETGCMRRIAHDLLLLRRAIAARQAEEANRLIINLVHENLLYCLRSYQEKVASEDWASGAGWVYILSTREQPDILKIGMTTRAVAGRVKEINAATGVLIPFSARRVFRVKDAARAERSIHQLLGQYRIRQDREFFQLPFRTAEALLMQHVVSEGLVYRMIGSVTQFSKEQGYGYIGREGTGQSLFFHISQIEDGSQYVIEPGQRYTFEPGHTPRGISAFRMSRVHEGTS